MNKRTNERYQSLTKKEISKVFRKDYLSKYEGLRYLVIPEFIPYE